MSEGNRKGSILVVDDEKSVRSVIAEALQRKGFEVTTASSGMEALVAVNLQHFDMMFLDVKMPGMSGLDVLSRMATEHPETTVVMLTAVNSSTAEIEAVQHEAFMYLIKPCDLNEVTDVAEKVISGLVKS